MTSTLDSLHIPALLTPDTTMQFWQSHPEDHERALMVTTNADRITFLGFWSQTSASLEETMTIILTRIRDGEETILITKTYESSQPHGTLVNYSVGLSDSEIRPGDILLVTRNYVAGPSPTMTRTMIIFKIGGWWIA